MNAYRNYNNNTSAVGKNLEKLSSGYKINRAGDDAAGLAVSQKMRLQIAGLAQAQKNAKSGISLVQTAEGALQEVHEMLERMNTLADQSANGTFDEETDRAQLQKELESLQTEIERIGKTANFNGIGIFKQYEDTTTPVSANTFEAKLDADNAAGLGGNTLTYAEGISQDDKRALNKALSNAELVVSVTDTAGTTVAATSTLKLEGLPQGYDVYYEDSMGDLHKYEEGDEIAFSTAAAAKKIKTDGNIKLSIFDKSGAQVAKLDLGAAGKAGKDDPVSTTVSFAEQGATAATLENPKYEVSRNGNDFFSDLDLSQATGIKAGDKISISQEKQGTAGSGVTLKVKVGDKEFAAEAAFIAGAARDEGTKVELKSGNEVITMTLKAGTKIGVTNEEIKSTVVGKAVEESGGNADDIWFAIGAEANDNNKLTLGTMSLALDDISVKADADSLVTTLKGNISAIRIDTQDAAWEAVDFIKNATNAVSDMRGSLGAVQNRLDHTIKNLSVMQENMQDAESVIRDTDVADEMMAYTKNNILIQSAQAMLAQANQLPQGVLQLLQ